MTMTFLQQELSELEGKGLRRSLREVGGGQGREIVLNGKRVLNFCSNNYLGLADDDQIKQAAIKSIEQMGFGSGASRLVCGNMTAHEKLEQELAAFKGTEACLVFSSGYMANVGVIQALVGRDDIVFSDKLNHASIVDGVILSRAELKRYAHNDMQALDEALKGAGKYRRRLIVTDTVFSMDGDTANLKEMVRLARAYDAMVMVDEAHGFGVLGKNGAGLVEEFGLQGQIDVQMGTLSKAVGCFGAYVCGSKLLREYLINHARSFIYTTAMPPSMAEAACAAIVIIKDEEARRTQLMANAQYLRSALNGMGFDTMNSTTPIIPILVGNSQRAVEMSAHLLSQGVFVQAIRPPTVPVNSARLRVTVMATHTRQDLDKLLHIIWHHSHHIAD